MKAEIIRNSVVSVGSASVLVSEEKNRIELIITNTSSAGQFVTISFGQDAVAAYGVYLSPYSTYYSSKSDGFSVYKGSIYAYSSAAAGQLSVYERLGDV
jgi:hypothetical protein